MTNGTSEQGQYGRGPGAASQQPQPLYFDQRTGQYVDAYGRVVQPTQQSAQSAAQPQSQHQYVAQQAAAAYPQGMPQYATHMPAYAGQVYQAPLTSQPVELQKKKRGKGFWISITIAIIALIAAGILAWFMLANDGGSKRTGTLGQLEGKTDAEIQAELDRVVEEGMFNISIASVVEFPSGTEPGELRIENVPGNKYLMQVTIARQDNGEVIYESGILDPNYHIQSDTLTVDLDAGVYPCVATFTAMDPETEDEIGQAGANITVNVLS